MTTPEPNKPSLGEEIRGHLESSEYLLTMLRDAGLDDIANGLERNIAALERDRAECVELLRATPAKRLNFNWVMKRDALLARLAK